MGSVRLYLRAATLGALSWSRLGHAQEPPSANVHVALVYHASDPHSTCPDEAAFQDLVTARLGYQPFVPEASRHTTVDVAADGKALRGRLTVQVDRAAPTTVRELRAGLGECDALVEALAAATSLALDPDAVLRPPPPAPMAVHEPPPPPPVVPVVVPVEPAPIAAPPPPPSPAKHEAPRPDIGLAARASVGLLPGSSLGGEVHAGVA